MSPEDKKAMSRRHIHLWDDGTDSVPKDIFAANYISRTLNCVPGSASITVPSISILSSFFFPIQSYLL